MLPGASCDGWRERIGCTLLLMTQSHLTLYSVCICIINCSIVVICARFMHMLSVGNITLQILDVISNHMLQDRSGSPHNALHFSSIYIADRPLSRW